jgi:hypothetical protein
MTTTDRDSDHEAGANRIRKETREAVIRMCTKDGKSVECVLFRTFSNAVFGLIMAAGLTQFHVQKSIPICVQQVLTST